MSVGLILLEIVWDLIPVGVSTAIEAEGVPRAASAAEESEPGHCEARSFSSRENKLSTPIIVLKSAILL